MSNERIETILARHIAATDAKREAAEKRAAQQAEEAAKRERASQDWVSAEATLIAAVDGLSSKLSKGGLGLSYEPSRSVPPALLAISTVKLLLNGQENSKSVSFSVGRNGMVTAAEYLAAPGAAQSTFDLAGATRTKFEDVILSFLEKAIPR